MGSVVSTSRFGRLNIVHVGVSLLANAVDQAHKCRGQIVFAGTGAPKRVRQPALFITLVDQFAQQKQHSHTLGRIEFAQGQFTDLRGAGHGFLH